MSSQMLTRSVRARGARSIEVRADVEAASDRAVQERFAGTAWLECDSWYRDQRGRIVANWPGYMREYKQQAAQLDATQFSFNPQPEHAAMWRSRPAALTASSRPAE